MLLFGCSDQADPSPAPPGFTIQVALPGQSTGTIDGDSTEWTTAALREPLFTSSMVSFDSLGGGPPPAFFYFNQWWPILNNGGLAGGTFPLAPQDSTARVFGLCYMTTSTSQTCTSSDSGSITILPPTGDSIIRGSVDAWLSEYRPATGPPFRVRGEFRLRPRQ